MQTGAAKDQTTNLPVCRWQALLPERKLTMSIHLWITTVCPSSDDCFQHSPCHKDHLKLVCWRQKRDRPIMSKVSLILTYLHVAIIYNVYYVAVVLCTGLPWQKEQHFWYCWNSTVEKILSKQHLQQHSFFPTSLTLTWHLCFCILYISWMKQHVSPTA